MPELSELQGPRYLQTYWSPIEHLPMEKHSLDAEISDLPDICKMYSQDQKNPMEDGEKSFWTFSMKLAWKGKLCRQPLQMFNFVKLSSVLTDAITKGHFAELFRIYSKAHFLMARRHLLSKIEKVTLKSLCYNFGALFPVYFPKSTLTQKIHELVFHIPRFVREHGTMWLFSEEEARMTRMGSKFWPEILKMEFFKQNLNSSLIIKIETTLEPNLDIKTESLCPLFYIKILYLTKW